MNNEEKILSLLETLAGDMAVVKADVAGLKTDMVEVKADIAELKTDMVEVKADIAELKADMAGVKADMVGVKADIAELKTDMAEQKRTLAAVMEQTATLTEFETETLARLEGLSDVTRQNTWDIAGLKSRETLFGRVRERSAHSGS